MIRPALLGIGASAVAAAILLLATWAASPTADAAAGQARGEAVADDGAQPPGPDLEYRIKAEFLYNFARFVRWPAEVEADVDLEPSRRFCFGVLGGDPFGAILEEVLAGKQVRGRDVEIRRARRIDEVGDCELVFVHQLDGDQRRAALARLAAGGTLTVGEGADFAAEGGMVGFVLKGDRVRFEINLPAAEAAGLEVSSKLLRLAEVIGDSQSD